MIKNVEKFLEEVNQEILRHEKILEHLKKLSEHGKAIQEIGGLNSSNELNALITDIKQSNENTGKLEYADYPFKEKFVDKIMYLCRTYQSAWRTADFIEIIKELEGEKSKTLKSFSQKVKNMVYAGNLVGAKYSNSNKYSFFLLPEWRTSDKKPIIKPGYMPDAEAFGNLTEQQRKEIVWLETKK